MDRSCCQNERRLDAQETDLWMVTPAQTSTQNKVEMEGKGEERNERNVASTKKLVQ